MCVYIWAFGIGRGLGGKRKCYPRFLGVDYGEKIGISCGFVLD